MVPSTEPSRFELSGSKTGSQRAREPRSTKSALLPLFVLSSLSPNSYRLTRLCMISFSTVVENDTILLGPTAMGQRFHRHFLESFLRLSRWISALLVPGQGRWKGGIPPQHLRCVFESYPRVSPRQSSFNLPSSPDASTLSFLPRLVRVGNLFAVEGEARNTIILRAFADSLALPSSQLPRTYRRLLPHPSRALLLRRSHSSCLVANFGKHRRREPYGEVFRNWFGGPEGSFFLGSIGREDRSRGSNGR